MSETTRGLVSAAIHDAMLYGTADSDDVTDAVIADLWQRALDPATVEAVAKELWVSTRHLTGDWREWSQSTELDRESFRDKAKHTITALLGPRPEGAGPQPLHSDDLAVDAFATQMKAKLARKRADGRGGWEDRAQCSAEFLSGLLRDHVDKGDPIDVANLAMMLYMRGDRMSVDAGLPCGFCDGPGADEIRCACEIGEGDE